MNCTTYSCSHLFKCKTQIKCLYFSKICDTIKDCIFGDNELSCSSIDTISCSLQCFCFAQSIVCDQLTYLLDLKFWDSIKYFKCYNCTSALLEFHFSFLQNLTFLDFKNYLSTDICIHKYSSLRKVDMSYNKISTIKSHCFQYLYNLHSLFLQNNIIFCVQNKAFHNLGNLRILDLSYNRIYKILEEIFIGLHNIRVVNLTFNFITRIYSNAFDTLPQNTIQSLNKKVCCMAGTWSKCEVKNDQFMNCNALLSNNAVSFICFSFAILTVLLNLFSIVIPINLFSELQTNKFFTLCLSVADCLYGLYLLIIGSADMYYRGYYAGAEFTWKKSFVCQTSLFFASVSFITSPIILFVLMLARFCVIQWPLTSKFKCEKFCARIIVSVITATVIFSFICVITFIKVFSQEVPDGMCLFMHSKGQLSEFILVMSLVVICVQIFCLIGNTVFNISSIVLLIKTSKSTVSPSLKKKNKYKNIVIHLLIVIFINMCCLIPSTVVFALPLAGYQMSSYILVWIIIAIVPINSTVDPVIFSILTPATIKLFSSKKT